MLSSFANLKARIYQIEEIPKFKVKAIACKYLFLNLV